MFAVFHKGKFVNWWLNSADDKNWVEITCGAMGWNKNDVKVVSYDVNLSPDDIFIFDDEQNLKMMKKETKQVEVSEGVFEEKEVISFDSRRDPSVTEYFKNGSKV